MLVRSDMHFPQFPQDIWQRERESERERASERERERDREIEREREA